MLKTHIVSAFLGVLIGLSLQLPLYFKFQDLKEVQYSYKAQVDSDFVKLRRQLDDFARINFFLEKDLNACKAYSKVLKQEKDTLEYWLNKAENEIDALSFILYQTETKLDSLVELQRSTSPSTSPSSTGDH